MCTKALKPSPCVDAAQSTTVPVMEMGEYLDTVNKATQNGLGSDGLPIEKDS